MRIWLAAFISLALLLGCVKTGDEAAGLPGDKFVFIERTETVRGIWLGGECEVPKYDGAGYAFDNVSGEVHVPYAEFEINDSLAGLYGERIIYEGNSGKGEVSRITALYLPEPSDAEPRLLNVTEDGDATLKYNGREIKLRPGEDTVEKKESVVNIGACRVREERQSRLVNMGIRSKLKIRITG